MKFHFVNVCKLVFGVDILDLNFGVQINSVEQPIKSNSVCSGYVSHRRTSSFNYHLNHGFVVFKDVQLGFIVRSLCVCDHVIHIRPSINFSVTVCFQFGVGLGVLWISLRARLLCAGSSIFSFRQ